MQPPDRPRPSVLDPTRARPEPWFVGSGRGLMILVVSLVGVLFLVRGVTMLRAAQDGWRWWQDGRPTRIPRLAPPAIPPRPRGAVLDWFRPEDQPWLARLRGVDARVSVALLIDATGRGTACEITASSGDASIDSATCRAAVRNARFAPARGRTGDTVPARVALPTILWSQERRATHGTRPADWISTEDYPDESIGAQEEGVSAIGWRVDPAGRITSCDVRQSSGHERLDQAACGAILRNGHYPPVARDGGWRYQRRRVVWRLPE